MDETTPQTTPGGALTPPPRQQPTAIAASTPRVPRLDARSRPMAESLRGLLEAVLDRLDAAADRIADAAGLR